MNNALINILIFRKRLLSYSETFIADQGQFLSHYNPVYSGYSRDPSGLHLIDRSQKVLLADHSLSLPLAKLLFRNRLGGGRAWLKAMSEYAPALIHAHFFNDGLDAIVLGDKLSIPVVTTLHGHDITKTENAPAGSRASRQLFSKVTRVIAVSKFIAEAALSRGCPEDKLEQHYIGIDLERFVQEKRESAEPSLLFVGRLVEKKGCTYLLQAMQRLKPRFPELSLTVVGTGDLRATLEREASEREIRVEFVGSETAAQIRDRLARCWLFVAPSITASSGDAEGLGMVFLEAQALHTPVVSFRSGGVVEAVEEGVTGLLSDEKDVAGLADNINSLLLDESLRRQMGRDGRWRVEQQFDVRKQCTLLERIYANL